MLILGYLVKTIAMFDFLNIAQPKLQLKKNVCVNCNLIYDVINSIWYPKMAKP